jgi:dTDP-4-dehydrorhamnose reductase
MYHEDLVKILPSVINKKGIINIGGKSQSIYNFAKSKGLKVKKITSSNSKKFPLRQDMSLNKLKKLI